MLDEAKISRLRQHALSLTMRTRLRGDGRAQQAYEIAEAFLTLTEPDARAQIIVPSIQLASGRYFDFLHPEDFDWNIDDIAHGLSMTCRFGGHPLEFYSTAQHSVGASYAVPEPLAFEALMHDAHEFAYVDMMTPLKILLPDYRRLEKQGEAAMRAAFGLPEQMHPLVKHADRVMLGTERRDLMRPEQHNWPMLDGIEPLPEKIIPLGPTEAKALFLRRYRELNAAAPACLAA